MTTATEVKKLVRPILERNSDLALVNRLLLVRPVGHVLRGVLIDGTSSRHGIRPRWFADHFFEPRRDYHITWGELLWYPKSGVWDCSVADTKELLLREVEEKALPRVRALTDLKALIDFVGTTDGYHLLLDAPAKRIIIEVAMGNLQTAREIANSAISARSVDDPGLDEFDRAHLIKVKDLCRLLDQDDRDGMAKMLHEWEAETVRMMKLYHLWEPTPFPLEEFT